MTARYVGRRAIAGSGLAALVLAAAAAGSAKAAELDGELLSSTDELFRLQEEYIRLRPLLRSTKLEDQAAANAAYDYADRYIWDRQEQIIGRMIVTAAQTPEGLAAKARALELWLGQKVPVAFVDTFENCAEGHELLAMSLARDVLGRAA